MFVVLFVGWLDLLVVLFGASDCVCLFECCCMVVVLFGWLVVLFVWLLGLLFVLLFVWLFGWLVVWLFG